MYWLAVVVGVVAWMLATRQTVSEAAVRDRHPVERPALSIRWNRATGVGRVGLAAATVGRIAWASLIVLTFLAVSIGAATWMY